MYRLVQTVRCLQVEVRMAPLYCGRSLRGKNVHKKLVNVIKETGTMKKFFPMLTLYIVTVLYASSIFAQYEPYTQMGLPDGAIARFGKGTISDIMYSPDGTRFAVTTSIGVWIYDAQSGEALDLIAGEHPDRVYATAYSPDSKTIATVGQDKTVRLWNAHTGKHLKTLIGHKDEINSVAYSPDGQVLATGSSDNTIRLWNAKSGKYIKTLKGHTQPVSSVQFSLNGDMLASTTLQGIIRFWSLSKGHLINTLRGYRELISYSPVSKILLVIPNPDGGNTVFRTKDAQGYISETVTLANPNAIYDMDILDAVTGQRIKTIPSLNNVNCFTYSPDGNTIAISDGERFGLWDATTGKHLKTLSEGTPEVQSVAYSPDGNTIATVRSDIVQWWNVQTGENIKTFPRSIHNSWAIRFSPDGKTIAILESREISLFNVKSGKYLTTIEGHKDYISGFAFSPDSKTIATGSNDGTARLWDARTGKNKKLLVKQTEHIYRSDCIDIPVYSPDGKTLAARSKDDNWLWLWDAHTGEIIMEIQGKKNAYRQFVYSSDGQILATKNRDEPVQLWNTTTGKNVSTLLGTAWYILFSPDDRTVATYTDDTVQLWNTNTGENINTLIAPNAYTTTVIHLHNKPFAITIYEDKTSSLWDVTTGQLIKRYNRFGDGLFKKYFPWLYYEKASPISYQIQCSPTGDTFVTMADHTPVRLWNITTGKLIGKPIKHLKGEDGYISAMYAPDGNTIAIIPIGGDLPDGTVRLWDVATGKHIKTLKGHSNCDFESVAFSPDSKTIATGHKDGTVLLWDIPTR